MKMKTWSCKIGWVEPIALPHGADLPMRQAIAKAYKELTGLEPDFIFSGWGAKLTKYEKEIAFPKGEKP